MMYFHNGNLLNTNCKYICHQVNCRGKMNSGIAKAIREKWPQVYDAYVDWWMEFDSWAHASAQDGQDPNDLLRLVMLCRILQVPIPKDNKVIINMASQFDYGYDGKRYTSYDAFWACLGEIKNTVPKGSEIAFPDHIGCCRGGANWNVILSMIDEVLGEDYEVHIYKLEETK